MHTQHRCTTIRIWFRDICLRDTALLGTPGCEFGSGTVIRPAANSRLAGVRPVACIVMECRRAAGVSTLCSGGCGERVEALGQASSGVVYVARGPARRCSVDLPHLPALYLVRAI